MVFHSVYTLITHNVFEVVGERVPYDDLYKIDVDKVSHVLQFAPSDGTSQNGRNIVALLPSNNSLRHLKTAVIQKANTHAIEDKVCDSLNIEVLELLHPCPDSFLQSISVVVNTLLTFSVSLCVDISDDSIIRIVGMNCHLSKVVLNRCFKLTDKCLIDGLSLYLTNLKYVKLAHFKFTDYGVLHVLRSNRLLCEIHLSCQKIPPNMTTVNDELRTLPHLFGVTWDDVSNLTKMGTQVGFVKSKG
jgi:hypothetical protein